jgi:hypothetical protein
MLGRASVSRLSGSTGFCVVDDLPGLDIGSMCGPQSCVPLCTVSFKARFSESLSVRESMQDASQAYA